MQKQLNIVIDCEYLQAGDFNGEIAIVVKEILNENTGKIESMWGVIDYDGDIVTEFIYSTIHEYKDGFAMAATSSNNWIFIDIKGKKLGKSSYYSFARF